ncbi:MAG: hypothetical protein GEV08_01395 [Acidimicrobiia bacterium]|nr:hypothetical protein [Acidimicrobiia bacterium]
MTSQVVKRAVAVAIGATMLTSGVLDRATAGAAPSAGVVDECRAPVVDPVSRLYTEIGVEEVAGQVALVASSIGSDLGPEVPTCAAGRGPACYPPVVDPTSRLYVELGIVEVPGAVLGPDLPTCETGR